MHQKLLTPKTAALQSIALVVGAVLTLVGEPAFAGQFNVVTTGGSTPTGAVNFPGKEGSIRSKVRGIGAVSQAIALDQGTISQAQADEGLGSGGAVIDLSANPQVMAAIIAMANEGTPSPAATLSSLNRGALADMSVMMPSGASVTLGQILGNLSMAIASEDAIALPTALNDGAIAIRAALSAPGAQENMELQAAGRAIADLLVTLRQSPAS
jgi:hypothetical protein